MHRLIHLAVCAQFTLFAGACSSPGKPKPSSDTGDSNVQNVTDAGVSPDAREDAAVTRTDGGGDVMKIRVASYNASLFRNSEGALVNSLAGGSDSQARGIAEVIQRVRPDVVLLNEFDRDAAGDAAEIFATEYLAVGQGSQEPIEYAHWFVTETNTGEPSGLDLDNSGAAVTEPGSVEYGNDAYGFGQFPGQYGMVVYSRFPIATDSVRSFRELRWIDMPDSLMPTDFYSQAAIDVFRLSSKNHVDVPVEVDGRLIHLLASHPTPVGFDGDENRNGRRNHDEVRFWIDYMDDADYLVDDDGNSGGLVATDSFVIVGDLNRDPADGDEFNQSIVELLSHPRVNDTEPASEGATLKASADGEANDSHDGRAALDTADFSDGRVGNLRVDYALPSADLTVLDSGVYWPAPGDDGGRVISSSDHRLVWVEFEF